MSVPDTHPPPAVQVEDLTVAYREKPVLWDLDLTVPQGVLMAVVGPNGAGKTTLLKAILGLVRPVAGTVSILGRPYREQRKQIGYVPQRGTVDWDFPTTVRDVVLMGTYGQLGWVRRPGAAQRAAAERALERVGMVDFAGRQIRQLSGGQQQRVAIGRALAGRPRLVLADEPTGNLDEATGDEVLGLALDLIAQTGCAFLMVTHSSRLASKLDRQVTLASGVLM